MDTVWDKIKELGQIPDVDLSRKLGVSPQAVAQARKRRGIKALNPAKRCKIDWDNVPLGKMTDQHISDIYHCSVGYICRKRKQKNIPPYGILYRTIENEAAYYEESIIDAWLHNQNIEHKFQFNVGKYRTDWFIPSKNEIWEFLGMWNHKVYGQQYREKFAIKESYLIKCGYGVRRIYRKEMEIFRDGVDLGKIHEATNFECRGCHRINVKHHAKGLCSLCIGRFYDGKPFGLPKISFLKDTDIFICEDCGSKNRYKRVKQKCHHCYDKFYRNRKNINGY